MDVHELLKTMVEKEGSDLHLRVPSPPMMRINGVLEPLDAFGRVTVDEINKILQTITTEQQREVFNREWELDFAYSVPGLARWRINVMRQRGTPSITLRLVPSAIPSIDDMGLPPVLKELALRRKGLILVTGPAGSGKSTTVASMINYLNQTERRNIVTIEDPIEFLYRNDKCIIAQRDVGDDTHSVAAALKRILRQDPDVIVLGEIRDLDTISYAVTAAETGHLVMGTLNTQDVAQTIDRIVDIYPANQRQQAALQLSRVIEAVLSQVLLPRLGGGRVAAFEIMLATPATRNLIREQRAQGLQQVMQFSTRDGMQTLALAVADLVKKNIVSSEHSTPPPSAGLASDGKRPR